MRSMLCVLAGLILAIGMATGANVTAEQAAGATPTFNKDVAPIIFNNCASCHRPDQVAPMSLMSYNEVRPWARAIKDKITKREMPPWRADGKFGEFRNDRRLSEEQIRTIVAWADGGAPQGDTPLTAQVPSPNLGWSHPSGRPPDFVLSMANPVTVAAEGEFPNFTFYEEIPADLKAELAKGERFIEAIQILPGVIPAVHHMSFGIASLPPGTKTGRGPAWPGGPVVQGALIDIKTGRPVADLRGDANKDAVVGGANRRASARELRFCCYVPGGTFRQYQAGTGQRVPKEGYISWGTHYTAIGKEVTDRTRVGLWFQNEVYNEVLGSTAAGSNKKHIVEGKELLDDDVTPVRTRSVVGNTGFPALPVIPPHAKVWAITSVQTFPDDTTLYTVWPHMHTRGKQMTYVLTYPDGREKIVLHVPNYDFNWQIFYDLKEPLKIPAGSTMKLVGYYDNSVANKWNPAPHKEVYWSEQSWDEMYVGFMDITIDKNDRRNKAAVRSTTAGQP